MIDKTFMLVLRRHLRYLGPSEVLTLEMPLNELGLDSMQTIALLLDLENEFSVTLSESSLRAETFSNAANLLTEVHRLISS